MWNSPVYKDNRMLSTLVSARAVETHSLQKTLVAGIYLKLHNHIITVGNTFKLNVAFLKSRVSTSEIHLNSLHVSKRNSEMNLIALQWNKEIQLPLKISSSIYT